MDLGESENIYRNPRLQHPIVTLKNFAQPCSFSVKFGCCNLGLSCTFLESPGSIEHCYVFGFPMSWGSWPDRASAAPCFGRLIDNRIRPHRRWKAFIPGEAKERRHRRPFVRPCGLSGERRRHSFASPANTAKTMKISQFQNTMTVSAHVLKKKFRCFGLSTYRDGLKSGPVLLSNSQVRPVRKFSQPRDHFLAHPCT